MTDKSTMPEHNDRRARLHRRAAIAFFVIVATFGILYWLVWSTRPDYFLVSETANVRPLQAVRDIAWSNIEPLPGTWEAVGLAELSRKLTPLLDEWRALPLREQQIRDREAVLQRQRDAIWTRASARAAERIKSYETAQLRDLEQQRALIQADITSLERAASAVTDPTAAANLQIAAINRSVDLANHRVEIARKQAAIADYVSREFGSFILPEDRAQLETLRNAIGTNLTDQIRLADRRAALRGQFNDLLVKETQKLRDRLNLLDFVYFSFGVSTTVTFGDITPNHGLVRALVTLQLLLSIVVVGVFVNSLS